jgi:hypothetical protein
LICADPSPTSTPTKVPDGGDVKCVKWNWLGFCKKWSGVAEDVKQEI